MLTQSQIDAIREHVALDDHTQELIRLATWDLYEGPSGASEESDYPGFSAAVDMISKAIEVSDLYIDVEIDEVIGDTEPHWHGDCSCDETTDVVGYYPDTVLHVDSREVVRALVGRELAEYV
jgi:hypothetical protein